MCSFFLKIFYMHVACYAGMNSCVTCCYGHLEIINVLSTVTIQSDHSL